MTIDAVPAERDAGHRAGRQCPCGPTPMRDLATGQVHIWRHRTPPIPEPALPDIKTSLRRWAGPR